MEYQSIYEQWNNEQALDHDLKQQLKVLSGNQEELEDAFAAPLEFGTAGMRGILGPGINRMNIYTVRQATEGLARFIEGQSDETKARGVVIAYDSRHMSQEFALEAAKTLAAHDIPAYVFEELRPTPELSFAVRHLQTIAGIMITASHNPAAYNGYKIYGESGGQMPPNDADALTEYVRSVENPLQVAVMPEQEAKDKGLLKMIGEDIDKVYLKELKSVTIDSNLTTQEGKDLKLVFTPLHGAGKMLGEKALKQAGFESFTIVPEQAVADPDFSTVESPNPEEHSAFEYAIKLGKEQGADLLVATDPDADRLGVAVRLPNQEYEVLSGNQIGALMTEYILGAHQQAGTLPDNAVILKSIVSSEFPAAIASWYDAKTINVLTGFKFIAEKIEQFQRNKLQTFMFGFEESYGYLVQPFVRDKDAIQALVLIAEVAAYYKRKEQTLYDALQKLFKKFGYYGEKTISVTMSGIKGSENIVKLMKQLRDKPPSAFGNESVIQIEDYQQLTKTYVDGTVEDLESASSNVLKYTLDDNSWIAIRPSGTEPKIKFYIGVTAKSQQEANDKIAEFEVTIKELIAANQ
ncbi:phospho-sugar mutase [Gracilibacillus alcaliphilus]|uniref:phospho-sugar mutase n=1 Tax=Gracilibacillus alcaliphilus TaxID=1401441 RepID=UPI00195A31A1|nr:phospho-sugar mutase [Gracilibacillus alcaliphilus]MBM7677619.1 phosphoglucomutase [Gracilibacillus alcaliphilus]